MQSYAGFVERVSEKLIGRRVTVRYIRDRQIVCGQFDHVAGQMTVNLARHDLGNVLDNYGLLLHELAHNKVRSKRSSQP
jgi:hypothetical protein